MTKLLKIIILTLAVLPATTIAQHVNEQTHEQTQIEINDKTKAEKQRLQVEAYLNTIPFWGQAYNKK